MGFPTSRSGGRAPVLAGALLGAMLVGAAIAGHDGARALQIVVLGLPFLIWLRWPVDHVRWRAVRLVVVSVVLALFLADGFLRAYLQSRYQALPDSAMVMAAMANTSPREVLEYAASKGLVLWAAAIAAVLGLGAVGGLTAACNGHRVPVGRLGRGLLVVLLLFCSVAYASKPWRRHHPAFFWPQWAVSVDDLRDTWADQANQRAALLANARDVQPRLLADGPSTVVLVITDSVNRDNMSLYGYGRETTPQLAALRREEADRWLTLRHAWSVAPDTVGSLSGLFSFGRRDQDDPVGDTQHILALARTAGYRVWWMSNHDDIAIDQQHAQLADVVEMINREPGRSGTSLDGELLDCLEEALVDPAPRKLVVIHLLGAHPHYRLRAPAGLHPFDAGEDDVEAVMVKADRPVWLRELRQRYDGAIRYHDGVVAETLRLTRRHAPGDGRAAWMFLSDHGQEVGHDITHAGHSPATAAGYRVPALLWRDDVPFRPDAAQRPFRVDWAGWTLAELLAMEWQGMAPERNVLDPGYRWEAPVLQAGAVRFDR